MISIVFKRLTTRFLVLGLLALVAMGDAASSFAAARAGQQAADDAQASATLSVRNTRFGRVP